MDPLLSRVSETVTQARTLEELTRPLLELLAGVTGMESTYLTTIDLAAGVQHVALARNAGTMQIPEGLDVPWGDTLCKRALDEGQAYTDDVAARWGDSQAAKALGIQTYASTAVRSAEGQLMGTLCAASANRLPQTPASQHMLQLFSQLIASFIERERLVENLRQSNERLAALALTDPLTELPNRRALLGEFPRLLAQARRMRSYLLVAQIDLDGFKQINDTRGHQVGDEFLREIGRRLTGTVRAVDMVVRLGGDEFAVLAPGAPATEGGQPAVEPDAAAQVFQQRLAGATQGHFALPSLRFDYGGASVGVVAITPDEADPDVALQRADAEMYRHKQARKARR